jgi:endo-1,4-beta-xylanase
MAPAYFLPVRPNSRRFFHLQVCQQVWFPPPFALFILILSFILPTQAVPGGQPTLRELAQQRRFYIGAAVALPFLDEKDYQETLSHQFNLCVAENAFKMESLRPGRHRFDFSQADKLAAFAQTNHLRLRGHTLVWHSQIPWWLTHGHWTRDEALQIMEEHITTVMQHFKGQVCAWDVVNEALSDQAPWGVRADSFWTKTVGPDYIEKAFEYARRADPKAVLYYNDYGAEGAGPKADAEFRLLKDLKAKNLVDGVGWQSHFESGWKADKGHVANAERIARLGLEISVTELDFQFTLPSTPKKLATQADSYRSMLRFCLSQPNIKAMVLWGFTDKSSWIPLFFKGQGDALIFDRDYKPKPAYDALADEFLH